jgi:uncharacterized protein (DUF433 family)
MASKKGQLVCRPLDEGTPGDWVPLNKLRKRQRIGREGNVFSLHLLDGCITDKIPLSASRQSGYNYLVVERRDSMNPRIVSDPNVCGGEPSVKGTRIPVHVILSHLAAGDSYEAILRNFPRLTADDIKACLEYAAYLATEKLAVA